MGRLQLFPLLCRSRSSLNLRFNLVKDLRRSTLRKDSSAQKLKSTLCTSLKMTSSAPQNQHKDMTESYNNNNGVFTYSSLNDEDEQTRHLSLSQSDETKVASSTDLLDQNVECNLSQILDSNTIKSIVESSSSFLEKGGVIAVPTDTIYGVACLAQNPGAVERIYTIKGRHQQKPIAISVAQISDIYKWSKVTVSEDLLSDLLPGPVTVVFERSPALNPTFNPHTHLIGVRIPDNQFMQQVAKQCDSPIALTSANISGSSSCLYVKEFEHLWPKLDLVVNGGRLSDTEESRLGSTVVDLSQRGTFKIIRPGSAHAETCRCLRDKYHLTERGSTTSPDR